MYENQNKKKKDPVFIYVHNLSNTHPWVKRIEKLIQLFYNFNSLSANVWEGFVSALTEISSFRIQMHPTEVHVLPWNGFCGI